MGKNGHYLSRIFHGAVDSIFGYDFFISYSWRDPDRLGRNYAVSLKNRLTDRGYVCFLDSTDYEKGEDWKEIGKIALSRTRKLLLVSTPAVFESEPVLREVRLFRRTGRQIVPIDIRETLGRADTGHELIALIPGTRLHIVEPEPNPNQGPSDQVVDDIHNSFRLARQKTVRRRIVALSMLLLTLLALQAELQRREATRNAAQAALNAQQAQANAVRAERNAEDARRNAARAEQELLRANRHLAQAHIESAASAATRGAASGSIRDWQTALLQALEAKRLNLPADFEPWGEAEKHRFLDLPVQRAFARRWFSPEQPGATGIGAVAYAEDGGIVAGTSIDDRIVLWSTKTGALLKTLRGHGGPVYALAFGPKNLFLASAGEDAVVRVWDPSSGTLLHAMKGHDKPIFDLAVSPADGSIASASPDGTARVWNPSSGQAFRIWDRHPDAISAVAFSADGKRLAFASQDKPPSIWDPKSGKLLQTMQGNDRYATAVAFSPDGDLLAGVCIRREVAVCVWDSRNGALLRLIEDGPAGDAVDVAFTPAGDRLAVGTSDGRIGIWGRGSWTLQEVLDGHRGSVALAFSKDPLLLASGAKDQTVALWRLRPAPVGLGERQQPPSVDALALIPDSGGTPPGLVATGGFGNEIALRDPSSGRVVRTLDGHGGEVLGLTVGRGGEGYTLLASASADRTVRTWDPETGEPQRLFEGHAGAVSSVAFGPVATPAADLVASASDDRTVRLWSHATGKPIRTIAGPRDALLAVAFRPDGAMLAAGCMDGTIPLWDTDTGELVRTLGGHEGPVSSIAFNPKGELLASAAFDSTLRLWDVKTGRPQRTLAHTGQLGEPVPVSAVQFSPDGSMLASATRDGTRDAKLSIWDPASGRLLHEIAGLGTAIVGLAFDDSGRFIVAASTNGRLHLRDLRVLLLLGVGQRAAPRAALASAALQRLWGLEVQGLRVTAKSWTSDEGLDVHPHHWTEPAPTDLYKLELLVRLGDGFGDKGAARVFDIRPLLDPPAPGDDKLDQLLDWLAIQGQ